MSRKRQSVRVPAKGYGNMIGTEFEGAGMKPGLTFFHVQRGKAAKVEKLEKASGDEIFEGKFHTEDCYLFLKTEPKKNDDQKRAFVGGSEFTWTIYFWKGEKAGMIYAGLAGTKAKNLKNKLIANGNYYDCNVIKERENEESEEFKLLFGGVISCSPGKRKAVEAMGHGDAVVSKIPKLYEVHQDRLFRIPIRVACIQDDRNYILDVGSHVYSYSGSSCGRIEKAYTEEMSRRRCKVDYQKMISPIHVEFNDAASSTQFYKTIEKYEQDTWEFWNDYSAPILLCFDGTESLIPVDHQEGHLFDAELLETDRVYVLDCITEVFVWFGRGSSVKDQKAVMNMADGLISLPGRPSFASVESVRDRMEPVYFRERFFGFDYTDLLEIKGMADVGQGKSDVVERRVSGEVGRIIQFLEEADDKVGVKEDLKLANDDSGHLTAFSIDQNGEYSKVEEDEIGYFDSGLLYTYVYSCKNDTVHRIFTWEGNQVSIKARTIAGITTAGIQIPGIVDSFSGAKTFAYVLQGREPMLLRSAIKNAKKQIVIHKGKSGGGYLKKKSSKPLGFEDQEGGRIFAFQVNSVGEHPVQATEVDYESLMKTGLYNGHSYLFLRVNLSSDTISYFYDGPESSNDNRTFLQELMKSPGIYSLVDVEKSNEAPIDLSQDNSDAHWDILQVHANEMAILPPSERKTLLYKVSHSSRQVGGLFISNIGEGTFCQDDLSRNEVYLLDTGSSIVYLWIGDKASKPGINLGIETAAMYIQKGLKKLPIYRERSPEVTLRLLDYGYEDVQFKSCFYGWMNKKGSPKPNVPKIGSLLENAMQLARMDATQRHSLYTAERKSMRLKQKEKERKSLAMLKARKATLQRGKVMKYKKANQNLSVVEKLVDRIKIDENDSIHVQRLGRPLAVLQQDIKVDKVNMDVRLGGEDWAIYAYNTPRELGYVGHGSGGVDVMLENIKENTVNYAVIRVKAEDLNTGISRTDRMLFVIYLPETVKPLLKAAVNVHRMIVSEMFGPFFSELVIREKSEFSHDIAVKIASKAQN